MELDTEDQSKVLFLREVGTLRAHQSRDLRIEAELGNELGRGHFQLHVFSGGLEVLNSMQPFLFREHALDEMVARRIAGRPDGPPSTFVAPPPVYPAAQLKAKVAGKATLQFTVRINGAVSDPFVIEATDPDFGDAALAAVRTWRFLPGVERGEPVPRNIVLPVVFTPPK